MADKIYRLKCSRCGKKYKRTSFWLKQVDKRGNRILDGREWNEKPF